MLLTLPAITDPATITMVNTALFFAFAGIAATLSGIIKQNHWPDWRNQLTVFVVGVLCALLYAWIDSGFTGDFSVLYSGFAGGLVVVMSRWDPLIKWSDYLQESVLVLKDGKVKPFVASTPPTRRAPSPLILPSALLTERAQEVSAQPTQPIVTRGNTPAPTTRSGDASVPPLPTVRLPTVPLTQLPPSLPDEHVDPPTSA